MAKGPAGRGGRRRGGVGRKGAAGQWPDPTGGRGQRGQRTHPGRRAGGRQEPRDPGRANAPGPPGLGRNYRADGRLAHPSQNGRRDRAGGRGRLRPGGQRQPGRPPKATWFIHLIECSHFNII